MGRRRSLESYKDSELTAPGQNVGALSGEPLWLEPPDHLPLNPGRLLGPGLLRTGTRPSLNTRDSVISQTQLLFLSPRTPGVCHLEREAGHPSLRGFPQSRGKDWPPEIMIQKKLPDRRRAHFGGGPTPIKPARQRGAIMPCLPCD